MLSISMTSVFRKLGLAISVFRYTSKHRFVNNRLERVLRGLAMFEKLALLLQTIDF